MDRKKLGVIFVLSVCLLIINAGMATARPINLVDYFAVGTVGQEWTYEYIYAPSELFDYGETQFTVTLNEYVVDPTTGKEHRIYKSDGPLIDPETGALALLYDQNDPPNIIGINTGITPYLACENDPKSISILPATRAGFDITDEKLNPISRLNTAKVFENDYYAWVLSFERGPWYSTFGDKYSNYVKIVVLDKDKINKPGDVFFNTTTVDFDLPRGYEDYRVLGYSYFAEGVGEIRHVEYFYIDGDYVPNGGDVDGGGYREYELVSTSTPASP